jgi:hypothetical protein
LICCLSLLAALYGIFLKSDIHPIADGAFHSDLYGTQISIHVREKTIILLLILLSVIRQPVSAQGTAEYLLTPGDVDIPPGGTVTLTIFSMTQEDSLKIFTADWSINAAAISLKGSTTITTYDNVKKLLQGTFSGKVMNMDGKQYRYGFVYGRFTVHLP